MDKLITEAFEFIGPFSTLILIPFGISFLISRLLQPYTQIIGHRRSQRLKDLEQLAEFKKYSNHIDPALIDDIAAMKLHVDIFGVRATPVEMRTYGEFCSKNNLMDRYESLLRLRPHLRIEDNKRITLRPSWWFILCAASSKFLLILYIIVIIGSILVFCFSVYQSILDSKLHSFVFISVGIAAAYMLMLAGQSNQHVHYETFWKVNKILK